MTGDEVTATAPGRAGAPPASAFRIYLAAVITTVTGNWAQNVALAVVTLELTGSAAFVGAAISMRHLPLMVLGPVAGRYLDRGNLAKVTAATEGADAALATAFFFVAATGHVTGPVIVGYVLVSGLFNVVDVPARTALVSDLVPPERVARAVSFTNSVLAAARVAGSAVAAGAMAVGSPQLAFALNALSFGASAVLFAVLARHTPSRVRAAVTAAGPTVSSLLRSPRYGPTLVLTLAVTVLVLNSEVALLVIVDQLGARSVYGAVLAAMGLGGAVGTLLAGRWTDPHQRLNAALAAGGAGALAMVAAAPTVWLVLAASAAGGVAVGAFVTTSGTYVQRAATSEHHARVVALYMAFLTGAGPLGAPLAGLLTDAAGPRWAALLLAVTLAVTSTVTWWWVTATPGRAPSRVQVDVGTNLLVDGDALTARAQFAGEAEARNGEGAATRPVPHT